MNQFKLAIITIIGILTIVVIFSIIILKLFGDSKKKKEVEIEEDTEEIDKNVDVR